MPRGGKRKGAGRKGKAKEVRLIQMLDAHIEPETFAKELADAFKTAKSTKDKLDVLKLYAEYRFGKPQQKVEMSGGLEFTSIDPIEWIDGQN